MQTIQSSIQIRRNGKKRYFREWFKDGQLHRDNDLPARIESGCSGKSSSYSMSWYKNNIQTRDNDLPTVIITGVNNEGHHYSEFWHKDNNIHRDNGLPAIIQYLNNKIIAERWHKHGKAHRADGPAVINPDGTIEYWIDGRRMNEYEMMFAK